MKYRVQVLKGDKLIPKGDAEWFDDYIAAFRYALDTRQAMWEDGMNVVVRTPVRNPWRSADYIVDLSEFGDDDEEVPAELREPFVPEED